ncbi:DUF5675 family protein [Hymenobacter sp. ASUV-10]|uniref:DUF5675 family protein n=1 Tax=Hymenobacter aranciens TaxID=3063996 RepID=A0ABT9BI70_9BACT|nr:DUF5675 family protein [Hymenobacter sp. ASUV-10]MDO7877373.1 DUF5675 family protein [Hymenobacter sp. ASUV-10]
MHLTLTRTTFTEESTIGELFVDGKFECYVLEDVVRQPGQAKVWGKTAIPTGKYQVRITYSNRFRRRLPLLVNVAGGAIQFGGRRIDDCGVRIHSGNTSADTEGCLLVGLDQKTDFVGRSRDAFSRLLPRLQDAVAAGTVTLTIS